jgi:hypothetical protein
MKREMTVPEQLVLMVLIVVVLVSGSVALLDWIEGRHDLPAALVAFFNFGVTR